MFLKMQEDNQDYEPESKGRNANETNTVVDAWEKLRPGDGLATSPRRLLLHERFLYDLVLKPLAAFKSSSTQCAIITRYMLDTTSQKTTKSHMQTQRNIRA